MCSPTVALGLTAAGAVTSAMGASAQAKAQQDQLNYQSGVDANNALLAEWQARDAISRGQDSVFDSRLKAAQIGGSQRASFAARGIALDEGSPLSVLQDTQYIADLDANRIEDNAAREAWGYRTQGQGYTDSSNLKRSNAASIDPNKAFMTTLLTSGGTVANSWYRLNPSVVGGNAAVGGDTLGQGWSGQGLRVR